MQLKNMGTTTLVIHKVKPVPGSPLLQDLMLNPGEVVSLFDEIIEQSTAIGDLITAGVLKKVGEDEPSSGTPVEDVSQKLVNWVLANDRIIQFSGGVDGVNGPGPVNDNTYTGPRTGTEVELSVTDGSGTVDTFNGEATVEVTIDSGTATAKKIDGVVGPVTVTFTDGKATVTISATSAGTVLLTINGGNTSLDKTDTATVTLS